MAKSDVQIVDGAGVPTPTRKFRVEAAATAILVGEPVKIGGTGSNYVIPLADGDPEVGTDRMVGIAASASNETASADGTVEVYMILPDSTVMRAKATTGTNIDTDAELLLLLNDSVTFDFSSSTYTIDENEGDDPNVHGLIIVDGDIANKTLDFIMKQGVGIGGEI